MNIVRTEPVADARLLWVMLPGAYMKPADFIDHGFVRALRERGLPCDAALLEATLPEMADGTALRSLQAFLREQTLPVRLLGISLGAHLALACLARAGRGGDEAQAASHVGGAVLLAPYLGPRDVWGEVAASGLAAWPADVGQVDDIDRLIWRWLQQEARRHDLHLGYGSSDRFAAAHGLMAQALAPERIDVQPGGHDWAVWTGLWRRHLDRSGSGH